MSPTWPAYRERACIGRLWPTFGRAHNTPCPRLPAPCAASGRSRPSSRSNRWSTKSLSHVDSTPSNSGSSTFCNPGIRSSPARRGLRPASAKSATQALAHPLWTNRAADQKRFSTEDERYGVGASLAMKNFGSGADAVMSQVRIDPDGRISVVTNNVDMGQGSATAHALMTSKALGRNADAVDTGKDGDISRAEARSAASKSSLRTRAGRRSSGTRPRRRRESDVGCTPPNRRRMFC